MGNQHSESVTQNHTGDDNPQPGGLTTKTRIVIVLLGSCVHSLSLSKTEDATLGLTLLYSRWPVGPVGFSVIF